MHHRTLRQTFRAVLGCAVTLVLASGSSTYGGSRPGSSDGSYGVYVLGRLAEACGFGSEVRLCRGPVAYAQAIVIDDREAILYNPRSLDELDTGTGNPWSAVSIIAHELGHHYYGHSHLGVTGVAAESILQCELDADYFSGYVLARVGASLADAQAAQRSLDAEESLYHPASADRLRAIEAGWLDSRDGLPIAKHPGERIECGPAEAALAARAGSSADECQPLSPEFGRW